MLLSISLILILASILPACLGWRALMRERRTFRFFRSFRREAGILGVTGSAMMAAGAYLLNHATYRDWGWIDSTGICILIGVVAAISFAMCGIFWFSGTKLAYWIDNRRWPSENDQVEDEED